MTVKITKTVEELALEIAERLRHCSGEFVAEIANQVLPEQNVTYQEDSFFEVETDE